MKTKKVKISSLRPHPKNPNAHPKEQVAELQSSLDQFDQFKNIVTWQGYIIAGHGLVAAAEKQGIEYLKAHDVSDWPEEKAIKLMIADNRLAEMANINDEILTNLLKDFDNPLDIPGIDEKLLDDLKINLNLDEGGLTDPDEIPEGVEPICKTGDLYLLGNHRLLCGNATKREDIERLMNGKKADMVFTDPPYGVDYASKNEFLNKADKGNCNQRPIKNDKIEAGVFELWAKTFENFENILSDYHSIYICSPQTRDLMMMMMMMMIERGGIYISNVIIWVKNNHVLGRLDYNLKHEPIIYGWLKSHKHKFYGRGENKFSTWNYDKPLKSDLHPTMKPVELVKNAILNSSKQKQTVFDPFFGSGTTLIAAEKTNRICYGMEIDEYYCDVILQRWANYTGKDSVREDGASFKELTEYANRY